MKPAEVEKLFFESLPAIFRAETGQPGLRDRDGALNVYPLKDRSGHLAIVWKGDVSAIDNKTIDCIAAGALCRSKTAAGAIMEAVGLLLATYPPTYQLREKAGV